MPAGRPTKRTPELIERAWEYIEGGWEQEGDMIPSHAGLCQAINVGKTTLYRWGEEDDAVGGGEIRDILNDLLEKQERVLLSKGLSSEFNSTITKLVLGKHDYHDMTKSENKVTGDFELWLSQLQTQQDGD